MVMWGMMSVPDPHAVVLEDSVIDFWCPDVEPCFHQCVLVNVFLMNRMLRFMDMEETPVAPEGSFWWSTGIITSL